MNFKKKITLIIIFLFFTSFNIFSSKNDFEKYFKLSKEYQEMFGEKVTKEDVYTFYSEYYQQYKKKITCFSYGEKGWFLFDEKDRIVEYVFMNNKEIDQKQPDFDVYQKIIKKNIELLRPDIKFEDLIPGKFKVSHNSLYFDYYKKTKKGIIIAKRDIYGDFLNKRLTSIYFFDIPTDVDFETKISYKEAKEIAYKTINDKVNPIWKKLIGRKQNVRVDTDFLIEFCPYINKDNYMKPVVVYPNLNMTNFYKSKIIENCLKSISEKIKQEVENGSFKELPLLRQVYLIPITIKESKTFDRKLRVYVDTETGEIVGAAT